MAPHHRSKPTPEQRAELLLLYAQTDALMAPMSCDASTDCCRFGVTGREPYPTAIEAAELFRAFAATGKRLPTAQGADGGGPGKKGKRRLPVADDERRCPMLSAEGRCIVYASRPFGCRTFFCDRAEGKQPPRAAVNELSRKVADLSSRYDPRDPGPRPLTRLF
jgi:Fe-S-cluster containining protein